MQSYANIQHTHNNSSRSAAAYQLAGKNAKAITDNRWRATTPEQPVQKKEDDISTGETMQLVSWGTIGTGVGAAVGFGIGALATGGVGLAAAGGALALGYLGRRAGQHADQQQDQEQQVQHVPHVPPPDVVGHLKSMRGLAQFQSQNGGSTQGTIAFIESGGNYYMTEQETNFHVREAAEALGITYKGQGRRTGYHAEVRAIDWLTESGIPLNGANVWVSKPVCGDCNDALVGVGANVLTAVSQERYHNWVPPTGQSRAAVAPNQVFRGKRSEAERLKQWNW